MNKKDAVCILIAVAISFCVTVLSSYTSIMRPWQIIISSLIIIIPIFLTGLYSSKIHKIHRLQLYNSEGLLFKILSGNTISAIFWIVVAVIDGALIFGQLTTQNYEFNFKALFIYLFFLYICKILVDKVIGKTYKAFYKPHKVIVCASIMSAILSSLIWAYFDPLQLTELANFNSIAEANIYTSNQISQAFTNSLALFQELVTFKDSFAFYFISKYGNPYTYYIINFITQLIFFFGIGPFLGFAFIKWSDLKRIWCPPSEAILRPQTSTIFWSALFGVIGILGYTNLVIRIEATLHQMKPVVDDTLQSIITIADKVVAEVDVDGRLLKPGTVESYNKIGIKEASTHIKKFVEEEIRLVNNIHDSLSNNVDKYLDWYYTLAADYARLGKGLMGADELENYMSDKFQEFLSSPRTETYLKELDNLEKKISNNVSLPSYLEFIKDKKVDPKPWEIVEKIPAPPIVTYPEVLKKMNIADGLFNTRMATSTGGGIAGAIGVKALSKKIAGKVAAKGAFKMGAEVLAKVAVKTTASAAGGAAAGAAIGSVVPGLGTAAGGLIGGVIGGLTTWIATDEIFLKAEELLNRDSYRQELLGAINEEKKLQISRLQSFLKQLEQNLNAKEGK